MPGEGFRVGDRVRTCDSAPVRPGMLGTIAQDFRPTKQVYDVRFDDDGLQRLMWEHELQRIEGSTPAHPGSEDEQRQQL